MSNIRRHCLFFAPKARNFLDVFFKYFGFFGCFEFLGHFENSVLAFLKMKKKGMPDTVGASGCARRRRWRTSTSGLGSARWERSKRGIPLTLPGNARFSLGISKPRIQCFIAPHAIIFARMVAQSPWEYVCLGRRIIRESVRRARIENGFTKNTSTAKKFENTTNRHCDCV